jgi:tetratricopeptide (TPR) repeat protein
MADLGLAIAGLAGIAGSIAKSLYEFYQSARDAHKDAKEVATHIELLESVLNELHQTVDEVNGVCSESAEHAIRGLLTRCNGIFCKVRKHTDPYDQCQKPKRSLGRLSNRLKWHFRKDEVKLLIAQLDSIKSTLHLMVTVQGIGKQLSHERARQLDVEQTSPVLRHRLELASQVVAGQRSCLADLSIIEEEILVVWVSQPPGESSHSTNYESLPFDRIYAWLSGVVGLSDRGSAGSRAQSAMSFRSAITLSAEQRSIAGDASDDVEMLLEKWTNLSDTRSRPAQSIDEHLEEPGADHKAENSIEPRGPIGEKDCSKSKGDFGDKVDRIRTGSASSHKDDIPEQPTCEGPSPTVVCMATKATVETDDGSSSQTSHESPEEIAEEPSEPNGVIPATESPGEQFASSDSRRSSPNIHPETGENIPSWRTVPMPILTSAMIDEDAETVRELRRVEQADGVRFTGDPSPEDRYSRVENWVLGDDAASETTTETRTGTATGRPSLFRSPFSDMSILGASAAPSVISSVSIAKDPNDPKYVDGLIKTANKLLSLKKYKEAASVYKDAYQRVKEDEDDAGPQTIQIEFRIGVVFAELQKYSHAERMLRRAYSKQQDTLGEDNADTQLTAHYLGRMLSRQRKWEEANEIYRPLWNSRRTTIGKETAKPRDVDNTLRTGQEFGRVLLELAKTEHAIKVLREVYTSSKSIRGTDDSRITLETGIRLGSALRQTEDFEEAGEIVQAVFESCQKLSPEPSSILADCLHELANLALHRSEFSEAEHLARRAWESRIEFKGREHLDTLECASCLGKALKSQQSHDEAEKIYREVYRGLDRALGKKHSRTLKASADLSEVLIAREKHEEAEEILTQSFTASLAAGDRAMNEKLAIAEQLGPLIIRDARTSNEDEGGKAPQQSRMQQAMSVYKTLYFCQRRVLGVQSVATLQSGQQFGILCFDLLEYKIAEKVLSHVWVGQQAVLGADNPESITTGYHLGQVFWRTGRAQDAIATMGSVYDLSTQVLGLKSLRTIESAEILALILTTDRSSSVRRDEANQLLKWTLQARRELFGPTNSTMAACFRVASISITQGRLREAEELFGWMFEYGKSMSSMAKGYFSLGKVASGYVTLHCKNRQFLPSSSYLFTLPPLSEIMFGLTGPLMAHRIMSSSLAFLRQDNTTGNLGWQRLINYMGTVVGEENGVVEKFQYIQAAMLLLQDESGRFQNILKDILNARRKALGDRHWRTKSAASILCIGLMIDALVADKPIPPEADHVNDWLFNVTKKPTIPMRFCLIAALACSYGRFDGLAKLLFKWLHNANKRLYGRLGRETLKTLATFHAVKRLVVSKMRKAGPSKDWSRHDPRQIIHELWEKTIKKLKETLENRVFTNEKYTVHLPMILAQISVWRSITRDVLEQQLLWTLLPIMQLSGDTKDLPFRNMVPGSNRLWSQVNGSPNTLEDRDLRNLLENGRIVEVENDDGVSIAFSEIIGADFPLQFASLGGSLLDLSSTLEDGPRRAESRIEELEETMTQGLISEQDIVEVKSNIEAFEKETEEP